MEQGLGFLEMVAASSSHLSRSDQFHIIIIAIIIIIIKNHDYSKDHEDKKLNLSTLFHTPHTRMNHQTIIIIIIIIDIIMITTMMIMRKKRMCSPDWTPG